MVKLFVVLGLALLAGGAYAIVDGWAYVVLERGFTEVILGALAVTAGLILLALAAVLAEVHRLKGLVSGAMAVVALSESRSGERPVPNEALARSEPMLERERGPEAGHIGTATTLAAGAGAAAVAGALTSLAKADEPADEKASDKPEEADKPEGDDAAEGKQSDHVGVVAAEPQQSPSTVIGEIDDWLLPPLPAALDVAPSEVRPDEQSESADAQGKSEASEDELDRPISAGIDEPSQPDDEERDEEKPATVSLEEPEAEEVKDEGEPKQETASEVEDEGRLWWPRIDRPSTEATASINDEFTALRDQLSGVVNAPEVELPRRDRDDLGVKEGLGASETWMAPRAWPPVTQPRDPGVLGDVEAEAADQASPEDAKAEAETVVSSEPAAPQVEPQDERISAEAEIPPTEKAEPAAETKSDEEPAASEEGVIGAYQVGETQFTMFADGSIHARTPDGDYTFASMDELKTYLANEKDKLEPSSS
ncbi:hypothetical protein QO058_23485 [Bosea vestrisii]|uniref:hypothetical protein n=1 Tax=Bosea vestrisii TaxID=151416 RepID=UPI0024E00255|nr:hypothetical protein [Bosea vestrisii]WID95686.1 hypothetical protein QO058_23485 [Bosea vestrisii]